MIVASRDDSSPIYGLDYVRLEFMRPGKANLKVDAFVDSNPYLGGSEKSKLTSGSYVDKPLA
ncbi:hypothetical protein [Spirosoma endbachense]|uniref:hypothetical protein n=1 Tax=Spirosoma endbachense TaxID=2666025 RepID=UPI001E32CAA0|nr:hypothetical protein [Spirosoma endbachense]